MAEKKMRKVDENLLELIKACKGLVRITEEHTGFYKDNKKQRYRVIPKIMPNNLTIPNETLMRRIGYFPISWGFNVIDLTKLVNPKKIKIIDGGYILAFDFLKTISSLNLDDVYKFCEETLNCGKSLIRKIKIPDEEYIKDKMAKYYSLTGTYKSQEPNKHNDNRGSNSIGITLDIFRDVF